MIHTDTLNESGFVEDTIAAFSGRTIHAYHTEGAGGGHAPDIIKVAGLAERAALLHQPDAPLHGEHARRASRHAHGLPSPRPAIPEDVAFAESRIRRETIAAEDILHDLGAISMISSDSQAMGRVGEVIIRTWQTAHKMKQQRGALPGDGAADNARAKRYVAKYTINPAIAQGIAHEVGSIEIGKLADLVLWSPAFFGVKPDMVLKAGSIALAADGRSQRLDPDAAACPLPPDVRRHSAGRSPRVCLTFVSAASLDDDIGKKLGLARPLVRGRQYARRHRQAQHDPQRRDAGDRGRSGNLRGPRGRRAADLRTRDGAADGAALLPVLRDLFQMLLRRSSDAAFCASGAHGPSRPLRSGSRKPRRSAPSAPPTHRSAFSKGL